MLLLLSSSAVVGAPSLQSPKLLFLDRTALGIGGSDERCVPVLYRDMRWSDESLDGTAYKVNFTE